MRKSAHLATAVLGSLSLVVTTSALASECKQISADLVGKIAPCAESLAALCAPATVSSGVLKGSKTFAFRGLAPGAGLSPLLPPTTLSYEGPVVYRTKRGELHLNSVGALDQVKLVFTEIQQVTGGTGSFAGATGTLFVSSASPGFEPNGEVPFESRISGEIFMRD